MTHFYPDYGVGKYQHDDVYTSENTPTSSRYNPTTNQFKIFLCLSVSAAINFISIAMHFWPIFLVILIFILIFGNIILIALSGIEKRTDKKITYFSISATSLISAFVFNASYIKTLISTEMLLGGMGIGFVVYLLIYNKKSKPTNNY